MFIIFNLFRFAFKLLQFKVTWILIGVWTIYSIIKGYITHGGFS